MIRRFFGWSLIVVSVLVILAGVGILVGLAWEAYPAQTIIIPSLIPAVVLVSLIVRWLERHPRLRYVAFGGLVAAWGLCAVLAEIDLWTGHWFIATLLHGLVAGLVGLGFGIYFVKTGRRNKEDKR